MHGDDRLLKAASVFYDAHCRLTTALFAGAGQHMASHHAVCSLVLGFSTTLLWACCCSKGASDCRHHPLSAFEFSDCMGVSVYVVSGLCAR